MLVYKQTTYTYPYLHWSVQAHTHTHTRVTYAYMHTHTHIHENDSQMHTKLPRNCHASHIHTNIYTHTCISNYLCLHWSVQAHTHTHTYDVCIHAYTNIHENDSQIHIKLTYIQPYILTHAYQIAIHQAQWVSGSHAHTPLSATLHNRIQETFLLEKWMTKLLLHMRMLWCPQERSDLTLNLCPDVEFMYVCMYICVFIRAHMYVCVCTHTYLQFMCVHM
jgi:hypothetical protein